MGWFMGNLSMGENTGTVCTYRWDFNSISYNLLIKKRRRGILSLGLVGSYIPNGSPVLHKAHFWAGFYEGG